MSTPEQPLDTPPEPLPEPPGFHKWIRDIIDWSKRSVDRLDLAVFRGDEASARDRKTHRALMTPIFAHDEERLAIIRDGIDGLTVT
jgi:hypothetical protein